MDCSPPGSSVHGICWARTLEWVAISFFRGSSHPGIFPSRDQTCVSCITGRFFTAEPLPKNSTRSSFCIWNEIQNGKTLHDFAPSASPAIFCTWLCSNHIGLHSVPEDAELILPMKPLHLLLPQPKTVSPTDGVCFFSIMSQFKSQGSH